MSGSDARDEPTAAEEDGAKPPSSVFMRSLKIAGLLFAIAVGGIAVWISGGQEDLPFEYEGFD
jgi:hypothetical protein